MFWTIHDFNYGISGLSVIIYLLEGKEDNKGINSGLLLSSFIIDYMIIRVKEKECEEEKIKRTERENERERENEEESKGIGKVACLITILRWR